MSNIIKRKNLAGFILGKNNCDNMQVRYQKEIFNQIEGILLNTKCLIKNQLTNYIIAILRMNDLDSEEEFLITA
jgi:hypothetical protein